MCHCVNVSISEIGLCQARPPRRMGLARYFARYHATNTINVKTHQTRPIKEAWWYLLLLEFKTKTLVQIIISMFDLWTIFSLFRNCVNSSDWVGRTSFFTVTMNDRSSEDNNLTKSGLTDDNNDGLLSPCLLCSVSLIFDNLRRRNIDFILRVVSGHHHKPPLHTWQCVTCETGHDTYLLPMVIIIWFSVKFQILLN